MSTSNRLDRRKFYELSSYLKDNAKRIVDSGDSIEKIAADAAVALGFAVTRSNAKEALKIVGIKTANARRVGRRDPRPVRTLARTIIRLAKELNFEVGDDVYAIAGRSSENVTQCGTTRSIFNGAQPVDGK